MQLIDISVPKEHIYEDLGVLGDPIEGIISKYQHHPSIKVINDNVVKGEFSFALVCLSDIEKEIVALDEKKSSISCSIPPKFLKGNINVCSQPLTAIINNGILNLSFDGGFKLADLIPMHKTDDVPNKKIYRNVSLLPVVSKIFEKLMQSQISGYVETYLKGYIPQQALIAMLEKWRISLDKGGYGGGVIMDLS